MRLSVGDEREESGKGLPNVVASMHETVWQARAGAVENI